jgi:hypothetical protein
VFSLTKQENINIARIIVQHLAGFVKTYWLWLQKNPISPHFAINLCRSWYFVDVIDIGFFPSAVKTSSDFEKGA